jgi:hypothetical protein
VVHVPDAQVVFCGDLLWKDHVPNLMDASTDKWIDTLDLLRKDYAQFVFVPGHGGVANSGDITIFQDYLVGLRAVVRGAQRDGKSGHALVDAILPGLKQQYGAWGFFDDFAKDNIVQTAQELAGHKQVPQPAKAEGRQ